MEKVQFQLEATLPELQDLHDKGLFTKLEINQITKRRTALETSLVRQKTRKEDYFAYAEYEINLERLRKVRWKRLGYEENPPPPSASTYSIPRRVLYILKRATVKFPSDLAVWLAYVEFAAREGMRKVVLKGLTNALQHHPQSPTIYLLLSYHHIHPNEPFPRGVIPSSSSLTLPLAPEPSASFSIDGTSSARTTLLLGLRTCPKSHALWTEYIKLELGWVEVLRRRWSALGLEGGDKTKTAEISLDGGEGSFGPDGEDARKAILAGQLVTQALRSALETIEANADGMVFRENLLAVLRVYPSPLRQIGLDLLHEDLSRVEQAGGKEGARAKLLNLTRRLYEQPYGSTSAGDLALEGIELVEELGRIGKEIRKTAKGRDNAWTDIAGSWLHQQARDVRISAEMVSVCVCSR
ncbi:U3 small nucleolar RNA-associated protein 6-domain-containing protein [Kockovaella imperatae]|uniref:U3 small nucleolar RNA-associated protein 6-domain-containing protein n=1 Tax=Kockovaella imperatae TaxID=4999 RepID=A0A1Y1U9S8_9TREE|nr:U3 small nucleolar RNA-associated protein 6-domain-containing protein [Kockovaella imperatae]ORX33835.1 U3 small nucleolar RNA-associated protein 6-domain-containing protein [Kockovaella imperatae]